MRNECLSAALDAGRSPTAPCGEAPTLMSSQAERRLTSD